MCVYCVHKYLYIIYVHVLRTCINASFHACMHTYTHQCIHTYIHIYIHAYIHYITLHYISLHYITYVHTYILSEVLTCSTDPGQGTGFESGVRIAAL